MSSGKGTDRQLCALLAAVTTVPTLQVFAGVPFRWVLLGTGAAALTLALLWRLVKDGSAALPELLRGCAALPALSCLALTLAAGWAAGRSALCFPQTENAPWTGLLVLALAAYAARSGLEPLLRCGSILAAALAVLLGTVLLFSAPQAEPQNLAPAGRAADALPVFALSLLPGLWLYFRDGIVRTQKRPGLWLGALVLLPTAAAAITGGCLSAPIAAQPQPFRVLAQSVSILGVMQRFETLTYGAELSGFFLLCAALLHTAMRCAAALLPKVGAARLNTALAGLAAALLYPAQRLPIGVFCVLTGLFCGLLPLGTLWVEKTKNFAKLQKKS